MFNEQPSLELLFEQLGLSSQEQDIQNFIESHQLPAQVALHQAPFWNDSQRAFLKNRCAEDDEWAIIVDSLNQLLHDTKKPD